MLRANGVVPNAIHTGMDMHARLDGVGNTRRRSQARGGARPHEATVTSAKIGKAILSHRAKVPMT